MQSLLKTTAYIINFILLFEAVVFPFSYSIAEAQVAFTRQINYQGKLTDTVGGVVADGNYNLRFKLYTSATGGSPLWTETWCYSPDSGTTCNGTGTNNRPALVNGLFSVMLGSTTSLTSINFNQPLYLGVEVGGTGTTPTWDGEMSPRKRLGTVPSAFEADNAQTVGEVASSSLLRSDTSDAYTSGTLTFNTGTSLVVNGNAIFTRATTTNATTTHLYIGTDVWLNGERFTDLTGTGLKNTAGSLQVDDNAFFSLSDWYATTTDALDEGSSNLYFTNARVAAYINASSTIPHVAGGAFGNILRWSGSAWQSVATSTLRIAIGDTTGTLSVARGGTGATTLTGVLKGNGTSAISAMTGTANYVTRWTDANTLGTGVLYDNGTNVGIGTTTPTDKLFVYGGDVNVAKSSNSSFTGLRIHTGGVERAQVLANLDSSDGGKLVFYTKTSGGSLTEAARFDHAGRMAIGVGATPSGRLHVAGSGNVLFMNSGNTGVGTTSPYAKLSVAGQVVGAYFTATTTSTSTLPRLTATRLTLGGDYVTDITGTGLSVSSGSLNVSAVPASALSLTTGYTYVGNSSNVASATSTLFISSARRVGIKQTSPGTTLDVGASTTDTIRSYGGFTGHASANIDGTGAAAYFPNGLYSSAGTSWIYGNVYFSAGASVIQSDSDVGIGTTNPAGRFSVVSADSPYMFTVSGASKGVRFEGNSTGVILSGVDNTLASSYEPLYMNGSYLGFQNSTTEVMRITGSKVGIGTTNPNYKLTVSAGDQDGISVISSGTARMEFNPDGGGAVVLNNADANGFFFNQNSSTKVVFDGSGNVGIGDSSPDAKLDIDAGDVLVDGAGTQGVGNVYLRNGTSFGSDARNQHKISISSGLNGRIANRNTDMLDGTTGYGVYDNSGGGKTTISAVASSSAPNSSGKVIRVSYNGTGTPNSNPTPGYGGFFIALPKCTGTNSGVDGYCYREGGRYHIRIWAAIPIGRTLGFASNGYGTGSSFIWLTPQTGTGTVQLYEAVQTVGIGGTLSTTGFWYVDSGANSAFTWDVARVELVAVDEGASVQMATNLNVGYQQGKNLNFGELLTTSNTYLGTGGGSLAVGTSTIRSKLTVADYGESTTQTNFTQSVTNAGILVESSYTANAYTPGIFWSTDNNNPTKPKAGIYTQNTPSGSKLFLTTSNDYVTGITNNGVVINHLGNVGIGTTTPNARLVITDNNSSALTLNVSNVPSTYYTKFVNHYDSAEPFYITNGALSSSGEKILGLKVVGNGSRNTYLSGYYGLALVTGTANPTDSDVRMFVTQAGNVGIGTTSPTALLHVRKDQNDGTKSRVVNLSSGTNAFSQFSVDALGVSFYSYALGSGYTTTGRYVAASGVLDAVGVGGLSISASDGSGVIRFYTAGDNERMRIAANGNVGIGVTSPNDVLDIAGTSEVFHVDSTGLSDSSTTHAPTFEADKGEVTLFIGSTESTTGYTNSESAGNIRFNGAGVNWGDFGYYPTGGDTGEYGHFRLSLAGSSIDTTPDAKLGVGGLHVNGNIVLPSTSGNKQIYTWDENDSNWRIGMSATPGFTRALATSHVQYLTFANGSAQGFAVGDNASGLSSFEVTGSGSSYKAYFRGSVGIGTASPSQKLDVVGFINTDQYSGYKQAGNTVLYASTTNSSLAVGSPNASTWMRASSSPKYSIAMGEMALGATPTGNPIKNTALGFYALSANTSGNHNTAVGANTLQINTTGVQNTALGVFGLYANTTGSFNTASGYASLFNNTTGTNNTAVGTQSLFNNTTGIQNTAVGLNSLLANTTGSYNSAFGEQALASNTTGVHNTSVGRTSMYLNTSGSYNAAVGMYSLYYNTSATTSTAVGWGAGMGVANYSNLGGTYVGYAAGYNSGNSSNYNTLIGFQTGYGITTGARNTVIGNSTIAASYNQITTGSNNIAIGNDVAVPSATASNQLVIGNLIYGTGLSGTGSTVSGGNIGIGIINPTGKLQVVGDEVRVGDSGSVDIATADGDLYVEDDLEVDGEIYAKTILSGDTNLVPNFQFESDGAWPDPADVVETTFIDGESIKAHRSVESGTGCYGWAHSPTFPIDPNKTYEFSVWIKSTEVEMNNYFGFFAYDASGTQISSSPFDNPYFRGDENDPNEWHRWSGYIMPSYTDDNTNGFPDAGDSSQTRGVDYSWPSNAVSSKVRFGSCYGDGSNTGLSYFAYPQVKEIQPDKRFVEGDHTIYGDLVVGQSGATNKVDIASGTRTGTHATGLPLYVTGDIGPAANGIEFRHLNGSQGIGFGYNTIYAAGANSSQELNFTTKGTSGMHFQIGGNTKMAINGTSGNVGIGTSTPATQLDLYSTTSHELRVLTNASTDIGLYVHTNTTNPYLLYQGGDLNFGTVTGVNGASYANKMTLTTGGSLGIGNTSPSQKLDVAGNIKSTGYGIFPSGIVPAASGAPDGKIFSPSGDYVSQTSWGINYNEGTPDYIEFNNASGATSRIALDTGAAHFALGGGAVGIGNSSPSYTLDVSGQGRFTDDLFMEGGLKREDNSLDDTNSALYMQYYTTNGNVVIGDTGVDHDLTVYGTGTFNENLLIPTLAIRSDNSSTADRPYFRGASSHVVLAPASNLTGGADDNIMYLAYPGDMTAGDTVRTRIQESLFISATQSNGLGSIGINTASPTGKLTVLTTNDSAPSTIGGFDARHSIVGPTTADALAFSKTTGGSSYITSLRPGVAWDPLTVQASTFTFKPSGGAGTFFIMNSGNVGVATDAPQERVQIIKDGTPAEGNFGLSILSAVADSELALGASASGDYSYIQSFSDGTSWSNRPLLLQPNGGAVTIGAVAAPRTNTTLDVAGGIGMGRLGTFGTYNSSQIQGIWSISPDYLISTGSNNAGNAYGMVYSYDSNGAGISGFGHQIVFVGNGTRYASIGVNSGNAYFAGSVGIGTTAPGNLLTVNQASNLNPSTSSSYGFAINNQGSTNLTFGSDGSYAYIQSWSSKPLQINNQGNNILLAPNSGNIGIGTTNPSSFKLQVAGNVGPETDATYDLGSSAKQWNNLYVKNAPVVSGYLDLTVDNLLTNGDFETGTMNGWSSSGGTVAIATGGAHAGNYSVAVTGGSTILSDDFIPVDPDYDVLQLEGWFKETTTGSPTPGILYFGYIAYDENKTAITTAPCGTYCYFAAGGHNIPNDGAWHKFSATSNGEGTSFPNFPVGTKFVRVLMLMNYAASSNEVTRFDHITLKRINHGPLFVGNNFSSANMLDQHQATKLYTTSSNHFIITPPSSGNVGIGTAAPANTLDVFGISRFSQNTTDFLTIQPWTDGYTYLNAHGDGAGEGGFRFRTNDGSAESVTITHGGDVGIGTTAPTSRLEISGTTGSYNSGIGFAPTGTGARNYRTYIDTAGSLNIDDASAGATRLTINNSGNIGIGNTSPTYKLDVSGTTRTGTLRFIGEGTDSGQSNCYYCTYQESGAWTSPYPDLRIQFHTGIKMEAYYSYGGIKMYNGYDGSGTPAGLAFSVGDGDQTVRSYQNFYAPIFYDQSNATYYLDPAATGTSLNVAGDINVNGNDVGNGDFFVSGFPSDKTNDAPWYGVGLSNLTHPSAGATAVQLAGYYGINFATAGGNAMVVHQSGNVGIGTLSPSQKLSVAGNALVGTEGSTRVAITGSGGQSTVSEYYSTESYPRWAIGRDLFAGAQSGLALGGAGGYAYIGTDGTNGTALLFSTAGSNSLANGSSYERMRITSSGNVGIGNTAPETKLQIDSGALLMNRDNVTNYKNVVHYRVNAPDQVGTMQIEMPKTWSDTMISVTIKGYDYDASAVGAGAWEVVVSGYNYGAGPYWVNTSAEIRGNAPFTQVRLAHNGSKNVILLGTTATDWDYPQVVVSDVIAGYSAQTGWGTGWSISLLSSEPSISAVATPTLNMGRFADGSAGVPSLSFFGDTNTGIYRPTTDIIGFTTGGTERARIDSGGNLIFAGSNPTIQSGGSYFIIPNGVHFSGGTSYFQTSTNFRANIQNDTAAHLTIAGGTSGYTYFSGNVGIGTTAPGVKLHVNAGAAEAIRIQGTSAYMTFYDTAGSDRFGYIQHTGSNLALVNEEAGPLSFYTSNTERARFDSTGNLIFNRVGIGPVGVYDATKTQAVWAMGSSYILPADGGTTSYGSLYGLGWSYNPDYGGVGNNPQSKAGLGHQLLVMMNGVTHTALGSGIWTSGKITTTGGIASSGGTFTSNYAGSGDIWFPYTDGNSYLRSPTNWITNTIRTENGNWYLPNSGSAYFNQGNIGIGTTSPVSTLEVSRTSQDSNSVTSYGFNVTNGNGKIGMGYDLADNMAYIQSYRYLVSWNNLVINPHGGNVGIGTISPNQGKVEVMGGSVCVDTNSDANASSCIANESDIRLKKNIESLSASTSLATLLTLNPVTFDWRVDDPEVLEHYPLISRFASSTHSVGLIAQEVLEAYPLAMGTETVGDAEVQYFQLEYEKFIPLIISSVKELAIRVNTVGDNMSSLTQRIDELAIAVADLSERIGDGIEATGTVISSGLSQFSALWVGEIAVGTSEKPTGITLFDEVTGEPYCFKIREGQVATTLGVCSTVPTDEEMDDDADTEAPIIVIMGNNPAQISIGETYNDLGVTVTDNINPNVGYAVFVDGVEVSNIMLDTSVERTYEIEYRAEDQAGNIGTATRTVIVAALPGTPEGDPDVPSEGDAPAAAPIE